MWLISVARKSFYHAFKGNSEESRCHPSQSIHWPMAACPGVINITPCVGGSNPPLDKVNNKVLPLSENDAQLDSETKHPYEKAYHK